MKRLSQLRNLVSSRLRRRSSSMKPVCPADQLPHELLAYVFSLATEDPAVNQLALLHITHVCARWRHVALAAQALWGRIVLAFPVSSQQLAYAAAYLVRSGAHPLDILWDLRDPSWDWDEDTHRFRWQEMQHVMRLFLPHFSRWRNVDLLSDTWAPIFTFLWYTKDVQSGPMLESVSLCRCNAYFAMPGQTFQPNSLRQPIKLFGGIDLPNLRKITLVGVHINWSQPSVLTGLTHLEFKYLASDVTPTVEQFQSIIEACPQLDYLSIYGRGPNITTDSPSQFSMLKLETLSFGFLDTTYAVQFFSRLYVPNLQKLELEDISTGVSPTGSVDASPFLHWFVSEAASDRVPFRQLQTLELQSIVSTKGDLHSFFGVFPAVLHLALIDMPEDALSLLVPPSSPDFQLQGGSLFPALQDLRCQDANPDILIEVVTSRAYIILSILYRRHLLNLHDILHLQLGHFLVYVLRTQA
ncbi:hypothetical protein CPB84DRAFT_214518 [Gymnopilus junonius]|uniref:F-box domain-containing protein n=1 Tax=Gymnopilus junonius TaxID=109634 RepID=A0A9P5THW0_GYMJU|nr:hypothetical protein CPB84DRAFT_214518 [Gymnopilus junonius]